MERYCARVLLLRNGVLEALGTPEEALDAYSAARHEAALGQ